MVVYHVEEEMKNHPDANVPLNKCSESEGGLHCTNASESLVNALH